MMAIRFKIIVCWFKGHDWVYGQMRRGMREYDYCWRCGKERQR